MRALGISVWPPLPPGVYVRRPAERLPFPLAEPTCSLFARARHALWQGVQALGLAPGDEVLVPAYHHGSEIEALARAGLALRFYDATPTLAPDEDELESLLGPRVRALHLTHYLGFPQDAPRWRAWCDARGLLLLEDAAQAWLAARDGQPAGSLGDLAIFCLYKTFGVPDGAALVVRAPAPGPDSRPRLGLVPLARRHAAWLLAQADGLVRPAGNDRERDYSPEEDFTLGDPGAAPAAATLALLPRVVEEPAAGRRRANYRLLLDDLAEHVPAPFADLPEGASPFAFPVESDGKARLLTRLAGSGIAALDFWSVPHPSLPAARFPGAAARRARTLGLPVHQALDPDDVERIARAVRGRTLRPGAGLRVEPVDSLDAIRDEWTELGERSENVFSSWEWASTWWRHFGGGRRLLAAACRSPSGRLVALLPLYLFASSPLRVVRVVGHGPADQLGPLCAPEDRGLVARALRRFLADVHADVFFGEQLPADEGWSAFLGGRALRTEGSPVLRFRGSGWEDVLASWSPNLRQQVRRFERRLTREHDLRYRLAGDLDRLDEDFHLLLGLHTARWEGDSMFAGPATPFQRDFAARALERGWLRLWFLELDGHPVSAWYGFRFGRVESYYQAGRDPAWERHSVGLVLLAHSIRAAAEDGMREYRFLRGGEAFKYRFANADPGLETVGAARNGLGGTALAASSVLPGRLGPALRRWLAVKASPTP